MTPIEEIYSLRFLGWKDTEIYHYFESLSRQSKIDDLHKVIIEVFIFFNALEDRCKRRHKDIRSTLSRPYFHDIYQFINFCIVQVEQHPNDPVALKKELLSNNYLSLSDLAILAIKTFMILWRAWDYNICVLIGYHDGEFDPVSYSPLDFSDMFQLATTEQGLELGRAIGRGEEQLKNDKLTNGQWAGVAVGTLALMGVAGYIIYQEKHHKRRKR